MKDRRLVVVHAHPDDECISTGGVLAKYAAEGAHVCLVTCTNGEAGEIANLPEFGEDPEALRPRLAEVRKEELRKACDVLGIEDVRLLGYHDSGMDGTPENKAPIAFVNQDFGEIVSKVADILREVRPHAVVTYNEIGFYGHPDHIQAHRAAVGAIEAAAGDWHVPKLYYTAIPKGRLRAMRATFGDAEAEAQTEGEAQAEGDSRPRFSEEDIERIGTDDDKVTTFIDVSTYVPLKFKALEQHRTQLGTTEWFLSMPEAVRVPAMGMESFVLARSTLSPPERVEVDLFDGLEI